MEDSSYNLKRNKLALSLLPEPISASKQGKGLVNTLINKLPFEAHLPGGYQYAGPGTHLDLKLEKGVKPKNKLDEAAMFHDIAYSESNNLKDRHDADLKLQNQAWERVLAPDSDLSERANAWLVTNTMRAKRWLGAGIDKKPSSTSPGYSKKVPVLLTVQEQQQIADSKQPLTLKLDYTRFMRTKTSVQNDTYLPVTTYQMKKIKTAIREKKTVQVKLSLKQIDYICKNNKVGGFLPALIGALPALAAVGTLVSSAINTYNNKKANDKLVQEKIRHNKAL